MNLQICLYYKIIDYTLHNFAQQRWIKIFKNIKNNYLLLKTKNTASLSWGKSERAIVSKRHFYFLSNFHFSYNLDYQIFNQVLKWDFAISSCYFWKALDFIQFSLSRWYLMNGQVNRLMTIKLKGKIIMISSLRFYWIIYFHFFISMSWHRM